MGKELLAWRRAVARHWHEARFGEVQVTTEAGDYQFTVEIYLGGLNPEAVRVELFANPIGDAEGPSRQPMARGRKLEDRGNAYLYTARIPTSRSAGDYTPRLVPYHQDATVPLEASEILWQR